MPVTPPPGSLAFRYLIYHTATGSAAAEAPVLLRITRRGLSGPSDPPLLGIRDRSLPTFRMQ